MSVGVILTANQTISLVLAGGTQIYTISYSSNDCPNDRHDDIIAITKMYTLTGLEEGTTYFITVAASLSNGETNEYNLTATTMTAGDYIAYSCPMSESLKHIQLHLPLLLM